MTLQTQGVLRVLIDAYLRASDRELYGLQICDQLGLLPGTVYPILARLLAMGWITAREEDVTKEEVGRATRRYYRLTENGAAEARTALAEFDARRRRGSLSTWPGRPVWDS
jgi:DNA-binding PadR family transcriptional regulator